MATARPMPLSPPVMSATRSVSRPRPLYDSSPWSARGVISSIEPGCSIDSCGYSGVGPAFFGSTRSGACGDELFDMLTPWVARLERTERTKQTDLETEQRG